MQARDKYKLQTGLKVTVGRGLTICSLYWWSTKFVEGMVCYVDDTFVLDKSIKIEDLFEINQMPKSVFRQIN